MQLSELKHFIVTDNEAVGPFKTAEVISYLRENPGILHSVQWITPEGDSPLLVMEWFTDFAGEGELEGILARQAPAPSAHPVLWPGDKKGAAEGAKVEPGDNLTRLENGSGKESGKFLQRAWRELLALFGVGLIGFAIFVAGLKSLRPGKPLLGAANALHAKLLSATPDALRTYQDVLESKILRDPKRHALSLIKIQKDRSLYPEGHLPSPELTASLALVHLSHAELDKIPEWKQLLLLLSPESRQRGLAVVAYELSRVVQVRREILSAQGKKKEEHVAAALEEVGVVLERLIRVIPGSEPSERMLHGLLLARATVLSLITILEYPQAASKNAIVTAALERLPEIFSSLTSTDREIVAAMRELTQHSQRQPKKTPQWSGTLEKALGFQSKSGFLCQLIDSGAASEALLFLLQRVSANKQKLPELSGDFEKCFSGLRLSPQLTVAPALEDAAQARLEYVTLGAPDEALLRSFRQSYPTMAPALARLSGKKNAAGDWLLTLYFNGVLDAQLRGNKKSTNQSNLCGKGVSDTLLCARARWAEMQGDWREFVPLLSEFQEQARPGELELIVERFVLDASKEILLRGSKNASKEIGELFINLKKYGVSDNPSIRFVLDYAKSRDGES